MALNYLLRGLLIGFSIAAPVGPIGILCIRRTLAEGRLSGFISGMGAASADALYGFVAGFGLTFISNILLKQQTWLQLLGGIFLLFMGIRTVLSKPSDKEVNIKGKGYLGAYVSTLFLTLTNPITILSFTAIFAGLGLAADQANYLDASILVLGVFCGSAAWWIILSLGIGFLRYKFNTSLMVWVNRLSGIVIFSFGIIAVVGVLKII